MIRQLLIPALVLLAGLCQGTSRLPAADETGRDAEQPVYLVGHGWHVGIALRRTDVPAGQWPEQADFPGATYLEVGWGDAAYYQDPDPGPGTTLRAGLWPTPSVLHVAGIEGDLTRFFPRREIIRVTVSEADLAGLVAFIEAAFKRDETGTPIRIGPGLYGESRFYAAEGRYHVFNNCNHWVARALQAAGLSVAPTLTAGSLLRQLRALGEVVQPPSPA